MIDNRHRLNAVVFRRTQADACDANGEPLFSGGKFTPRRFVLPSLSSDSTTHLTTIFGTVTTWPRHLATRGVPWVSS